MFRIRHDSISTSSQEHYADNSAKSRGEDSGCQSSRVGTVLAVLSGKLHPTHLICGTGTIVWRADEFDAGGFERNFDCEERVCSALRDAIDYLKALDRLNANA
jgi:hypothetical protein